MKQCIVLLFLLMLVQLNAQPYEHSYLVKVGDMAPDFQITELNGKTYRLSDLRGSVVMLQFTASWCPVCLKKKPYIENEIWLPGKSKGLKVIGICYDESKEKVKEFTKMAKVTYPLVPDMGGDIFGLYAVKGSGVTRDVVIDRNGKIIALTRLFNIEEFNAMKEIIFKELDRK